MNNLENKNWTEYTPFEWLMVDVASRYGLDKEHNHVRIQWVVDNVLPLIKLANGDYPVFKQIIKPMINNADEKPMFAGAVLALWDTLQGIPTTWEVGQDAASSGPQLLSVMGKCRVGMSNTGVLGQDVPDLYTTVTDEMGDGTERSIVKKGIVPHVYASEREPKRVFKKKYPTFLKAYRTTVPFAQESSDIMVMAWNQNALEHLWFAPDGATIRVPVIVQQKKRIPCGKHTLDFIYNELGTKKKGEAGTKSLSANITHSYDAYMLRELNRRCNYDPIMIRRAIALLKRNGTRTVLPNISGDDKLLYLEQLASKFNQISAVAFEYLDEANCHHITEAYAAKLLGLAETMLMHKPFTISNIHDEFKCLPMNVTWMKTTYNQLLVETYVSKWWFETLYDLTGNDFSLMAGDIDESIIDEIRNAPYSIG